MTSPKRVACGTCDGLDADERPAECECDELHYAAVPCWPCYREGFDQPAADAE